MVRHALSVMNERRLLERIASVELDQELGHMTRTEILINSILDHLHRILNTRQGSVPIDPAFGVPDFTNLAGSFSAGTTDQIIEDMSRMIQRYEPRLHQPRITFSTSQDDVLSLAFSIAGTINIGDRAIPVRLSSHVSSNGQVSLRKQ